MPQQDYVKAARPAPRSRKKANTPKPIPKLLIAAVILLILLFAYFLWYITTRPGAEALADEARAGNPVTEKAQEELPAKPSKEPYTYIKELETKEVQVTAEQLESKKPATMYCGPYTDLQTAQQLKAKIAFAGVVTTLRESGGRYRVVAGPYTSRRQAQNDRNLLQRQKIANCWIPL